MTVSWDELNTADLIFGKDCAAGGVEYMLRAPSVGSGSTGSGESRTRHAPKQRMGQNTGQERRIYQKLERDLFVGAGYFELFAWDDPCEPWGYIRPASGPAAGPRIPARLSVSAPSLKS